MDKTNLRQAWDAVVKPPQGWQGALHFFNEHGQKIRYGFAPAKTGPDGMKKGSIVLTHGYGEHLDLYYETIKRFQARGYDVWGMDWKGHGKSDRDNPFNPMKPSTEGMIHHVYDLDFFVRHIIRPQHNPVTPLILTSHSMGGHTGLLHLQKYPGLFDGAIFSAPLFDIYRLGLGRWFRPILRFMFNTLSALGFRDSHVPSTAGIWNAIPKPIKYIINLFKKDQPLRTAWREVVRDTIPGAKLGRPTFGWVAAVFNTIAPSMKPDFLRSIDTPVLIGSASKEDLVANDSHARAAALMPHATHVTIQNAGHALWFENDDPYEEWWGHIDSFLPTVTPTEDHPQTYGPNNNIVPRHYFDDSPFALPEDTSLEAA